MEKTGRGWWAPPKGTHTGKLRLNAKGRALFNKGTTNDDYIEIGKVELRYTDKEDKHELPNSERNQDIIDERVRWGITNWNKTIASLTKDEEDAVEEYVSGNTRSMLLEDPPDEQYWDDDYEKTWLKNMDKAVKKGKIPHNMKIFRGMYPPQEKYRKMFLEAPVGSTFKSKSFLSTSIDKRFSDDWTGMHNDALLFEIRAKKGQNGLYVGSARFNNIYNHSGSQPQWELILPRNCTFKIIENTTIPRYNVGKDPINKPYIVLELMSQGENR